MEAGAGIEPANRGFADPGLTTWLPRPLKNRASVWKEWTNLPKVPCKCNRFCGGRPDFPPSPPQKKGVHDPLKRSRMTGKPWFPVPVPPPHLPPPLR